VLPLETGRGPIRRAPRNPARESSEIAQQ